MGPNHFPIERPNTVPRLEAKKKQPLSELKAAKKAVNSLKIDTQHIKAVTHLFTDGATRAIPRRDVQFRAEKDEVQRHVLKCLRESARPITNQDVAEAYCKVRKLEFNHDTYVLIGKRMVACVTKFKTRGVIEEVSKGGQFKAWRLTPQ